MRQTFVAVVDDDPEIRTLLREYLERHDLSVGTADGGAALDRLIQTRGAPDVLVLDLMMPGEDGLAICRRLRATSAVPIIMLSARGEDIDRIVGLEVGADDYLPKPFNPRELLARIRALVRRAERPRAETRRRSVGGMTVDLDRRIVLAGEEELQLTAGEFDLFLCLVERANRVLSREQLMEMTRGRNMVDPLDRAIDVSMSRLRRKLEDAGFPPDGLKTVRGQGYVLALPVEDTT